VAVYVYMSTVNSTPLVRAASIFAIAASSLPPVGPSPRLEVIDLGANVGLLRNRDHFVDRFEQTVPLAAHVRNVHAAGLPGDLRELDQFLDRRKTWLAYE
jgi:hypothetical protein